jgi:hypothetical protein
MRDFMNCEIKPEDESLLTRAFGGKLRTIIRSKEY